MIGVTFPWACRILDHGSNAGAEAGNKFGCVSGDDNEVFQGSNRRDEEAWLSKGVATLLSLDYHGFPADNHVLGNGEDAVGEQRPERSVKS